MWKWVDRQSPDLWKGRLHAHEPAHAQPCAHPSSGGRMQTLCTGATLKLPNTPGCVEECGVRPLLPSMFRG